MFKALFRRNTALHDAHALYGKVVARSRDPILFGRHGVPDTFDGRFEMLAMHLFLLHHRLKDEDAKAREVSQCVFDCFIDDMDSALREAAVGDQTVPKRINKMTRVFYGRTGAYEKAFDADAPREALSEMLARNLHPDDPDARDCGELADYVLAEAAVLADAATDAIIGEARAFEGAMA